MNAVNRKSDPGVRCGIVLAAGEGMRLRPFIHQLRGDTLPKQYVNFIGTRSMLEHTFHRAERLIPSERLFTVVSSDHFKHREVEKQLSGRPKGTVILQPENKETGPGILLPLMHLYKRYPESVVVVFPSDHFIMEEAVFMGHVELACHVVEQEPSRLVLLGVEPYGPETEYGYILPDRELNDVNPPAVRRVMRFIEKPERQAAQELVQRGALWNTLVMAVQAKTLLKLIHNVMPSLHRSFHRILRTLGTAREVNVVKEAYRKMEPVNFSSQLLEAFSLHHSSHLAVIPVRGVLWSDWGSEQRIIRTLRERRLLGAVSCRADRVVWNPGE